MRWNQKTGTHVFFGEAKVENPNHQAQAAAVEKIKNSSNVQAPPANLIQEEDSEDEVDSSLCNEEDIKLVMEQADVKRNQAVKALLKNNGEVVDAIMELTM